MNSHRPPAFQWYVKDWLTSKKRAVMSLEQQGAYLNLLCHCWDSADCSLPGDDAALAALSEARDRWSTIGPEVRACFIVHPKQPDRLTNKRLLFEFKQLCRKRRERQKSGQIGGANSGRSRRNSSAKQVEAQLPVCFDSASSKREAKRSSSSSSSSSSSDWEKRRDRIRSGEGSVRGPARMRQLTALEALTLTPEIQTWAMKTFGITIPEDVLDEFKDHWRQQPKLRDAWTATFKSRVRQLVAWGRLKPTSDAWKRDFLATEAHA